MAEVTALGVAWAISNFFTQLHHYPPYPLPQTLPPVRVFDCELDFGNWKDPWTGSNYATEQDAARSKVEKLIWQQASERAAKRPGSAITLRDILSAYFARTLQAAKKLESTAGVIGIRGGGVPSPLANRLVHQATDLHVVVERSVSLICSVPLNLADRVCIAQALELPYLLQREAIPAIQAGLAGGRSPQQLLCAYLLRVGRAFADLGNPSIAQRYGLVAVLALTLGGLMAAIPSQGEA